MDESRVRFPVVCPECRKEMLSSFRIADLMPALLNGRKIALHASCHGRTWIASDAELEQIRQYLGAVRIDSHSGTEWLR